MFFQLNIKKKIFPQLSLNAAFCKDVLNFILFYFFSICRYQLQWRWQFDALLTMKMLSKALIFKLCTAVTPWIGIEVAWVVTQGGSS